MAISAQVRGVVEAPGEFTVPAKLLQDYISLLPSGKVELILKDDVLRSARPWLVDDHAWNAEFRVSSYPETRIRGGLPDQGRSAEARYRTNGLCGICFRRAQSLVVWPVSFIIQTKKESSSLPQRIHIVSQNVFSKLKVVANITTLHRPIESDARNGANHLVLQRRCGYA